MAWTYDPAQLSNNLMMQVRLRIGDTNPDDPLLQDEEIWFFLKETDNNVLQASVRACTTVIAYLSSKVDFRIGPYQESHKGRLTWYEALLEQLSSQNPGMTILMRPPTTPPIFKYEFLSPNNHIDEVSDMEDTI